MVEGVRGRECQSRADRKTSMVDQRHTGHAERVRLAEPRDALAGALGDETKAVEPRGVDASGSRLGQDCRLERRPRHGPGGGGRWRQVGRRLHRGRCTSTARRTASAVTSFRRRPAVWASVTVDGRMPRDPGGRRGVRRSRHRSRQGRCGAGRSWVQMLAAARRQCRARTCRTPWGSMPSAVNTTGSKSARKVPNHDLTRSSV
jgi:hypothetical protein